MPVKIAYSKNSDFEYLVNLLDAELNERNGDLQKEYDKHNTIDSINDVVIIYKDEVPAACGAFKEYEPGVAELKRIFTDGKCRGQGLGTIVVCELEKLARRKGYEYAILETGTRHFEAISLYKKLGYSVIPNYGPYAELGDSVCMRKKL